MVKCTPSSSSYEFDCILVKNARKKYRWSMLQCLIWLYFENVVLVIIVLIKWMRCWFHMLEVDSHENGFDQPRPENKRQRRRIDEIQHEVKQESHHQCKAVRIVALFSQFVSITKSYIHEIPSRYIVSCCTVFPAAEITEMINRHYCFASFMSIEWSSKWNYIM